jgi:acyl-CoA oxidase
MADQLLSGRICIASMTMAACKSSLYNAIRYAQSRLGVNADGKSSAPLIDYQLQQKALLPLLAETYALSLGLNKVKNNYAQLQGEENAEKETNKELIKMCCVIKPMVTWHGENAATIGRERCGGQGYLACNRFGETISGAHAGITAEGDNSVLMQKVAKELLQSTTISEVLKETTLSFIPGSLTRLLTLAKPLALVQLREKRLLAKLALKMQKVKGKEAIFNKWMVEESDLVQEVALSYGESFVLQNFHNICKEQNNPLLNEVCDLYGAMTIKKHLSWYLQEGILKASSCRRLDSKINTTCKKLNERLEELLDGFDIPEHLLFAPIAKDWQSYNDQKEDNQGEINPKHPFLVKKQTRPKRKAQITTAKKRPADLTI